MFENDLYPNVYDKAAAYLYHILQNHPFNDANKRTGFGTAYLFLKANNLKILFDDEPFEILVVGVASLSRRAQKKYKVEFKK